MATVTVDWRNGSTTSFETADPEVIARYKGYVLTDPGIIHVEVTE